MSAKAFRVRIDIIISDSPERDYLTNRFLSCSDPNSDLFVVTMSESWRREAGCYFEALASPKTQTRAPQTLIKDDPNF